MDVFESYMRDDLDKSTLSPFMKNYNSTYSMFENMSLDEIAAYEKRVAPKKNFIDMVKFTFSPTRQKEYFAAKDILENGRTF